MKGFEETIGFDLYAQSCNQVALLASSDFASVLCSLESQKQQMRLASEWHIAMDVVLTEIKVPVCFPII